MPHRPTAASAATAAAPAPPLRPAPSPAAPRAGALGRRDRRSCSVVGIARPSAVRATRADDGPGHPDEWDPRVADLAAFVEDERGLDFDHPVYVDFLTAAEYTRGDRRGRRRRDAEDEAARSSTASVGAAPGARGGVRRARPARRAQPGVDGGTLAFYDPADERDPRAGHRDDGRAARSPSCTSSPTRSRTSTSTSSAARRRRLDSGEAAALRGLAEGDALRIEDGYIDEELDRRRAGRLRRGVRRASSTGARRRQPRCPPFIEATFGAPYALGPPFVTMLVNHGRQRRGRRGLRRAPRPPRSTCSTRPASSPTRAADDVDLGLDDDEVDEEGPSAPRSWFLVLAERIDPKVALEAALAGTATRYARLRARTAPRASGPSSGATPRRTRRRWARRIEAWVAGAAGRQGRARRRRRPPGLDACDPGADVDMELTGRSDDVARACPNLWGYLVAGARRRSARTARRCYAPGVLDGLAYERVIDPDPSVRDAAVRRARRRNGAPAPWRECGSGER